MAVWSMYDPTTGWFNGKTFSARRSQDVRRNLRNGFQAIEGDYDYLTQMVDLATGQVVARNPPGLAANRVPHQRIVRLEQQQTRPLRELSIDPKNTAARQRLVDINNQIAELRAQMAREP